MCIQTIHIIITCTIECDTQPINISVLDNKTKGYRIGWRAKKITGWGLILINCKLWSALNTALVWKGQVTYWDKSSLFASKWTEAFLGNVILWQIKVATFSHARDYEKIERTPQVFSRWKKKTSILFPSSNIWNIAFALNPRPVEQIKMPHPLLISANHITWSGWLL